MKWRRRGQFKYTFRVHHRTTWRHAATTPPFAPPLWSTASISCTTTTATTLTTRKSSELIRLSPQVILYKNLFTYYFIMQNNIINLPRRSVSFVKRNNKKSSFSKIIKSKNTFPLFAVTTSPTDPGSCYCYVLFYRLDSKINHL